MAQNWVSPGVIADAIDVPSSKSVALRYLLIASVAQGKSVIHNLTYCDDVEALLSNFEPLGIGYTRSGRTLTISGGKWRQVEKLDCGESGFLARTLPFLCAAQGIECEVVGRGTLLRRDLQDLVSVFQAAGGKLSGVRLPLHVAPFVMNEHIEISRQTSSQSLSGLLMALPLTNRHTCLYFNNLPSKGYITLTLDAIRKFGAFYKETGSIGDALAFSPSVYLGHNVSVPSDWSAAAQLIAALQVGDSVLLHGLEHDSMQPDRAIIALAEKIGFTCRWESTRVRVALPRRPSCFSFDATNCPDLFPALAAIATQCEGETCIAGVERLRNKESDRGAALVAMLDQYGIASRIDGDALYVRGGKPQPKGVIPCAHDHRIAMAAGAIALRCNEPVYLDDMACVRKSFPNFFEVLISR